MKNIHFLLILIFVFFSACKKENPITQLQNDQKTLEDNNLAEVISDNASLMSDDAYNNNGTKLTVRSGDGSSAVMGDTVKLTFDRADSTITIDFGTNGITSQRDGKTRKGKLIVAFSNGYFVTGAKHTVSFDQYYVDDIKVNGTKEVTYNGKINNIPEWDINSNLNLTKPNGGGTVTWSSTRKRKMTGGSSTPFNWLDDQYSITGSANGTASNGQSYSIVINQDLIVKAFCRYIQNGILTFTRGNSTFSLDYGYGGTTSQCESSAELNYNGSLYVINL